MLEDRRAGLNVMAAVATTSVCDSATARAATSLDLFYPMNEFYEREHASVPRLIRVAGCDVPEPYRSLLVNDRDMTPTLAEAYRRRMHLRILKRFQTADVFARQIVLESEGESKVTVFAAIKIYLDRFPAETKRLILEGKLPFGTVLQEQGIAHSSRPSAFFRVVSDETMNQALGLKNGAELYGRRNALLNEARIPLAQVLEILPPS